jgi:hypothetical protein
LATGGSGVVSAGNLPDVLVDALAREAAKLASQWLNICIRALDYCPPVNLTFGDYLRSLVTADADVVPDDERSYRVAFVSAFRDRGIYAEDVRSVAVGSLLWEPPTLQLHSLAKILRKMSLGWSLHSDRRNAYNLSRLNARTFHDWLLSPGEVSDEEIDALGLARLAAGTSEELTLAAIPGDLHGIEVHSVRPARRIGPDEQARIDLIVEITQTWHPKDPEQSLHRGGVTLIIDLEREMVRYMVRNRVGNEDSYKKQLDFEQAVADESLSANYFSRQVGNEPFAMLHRVNPFHETVHS